MIKLITEHKDYLLLVTEFTGVEGIRYKLTDEAKHGGGYIVEKMLYEGDYGGKDLNIIAASPKLGDLPLLPELPKQEEDVDELFNKHYKNINYTQDSIYKETVRRDFIAGHKAASKKWSDEDLWNIIQLQSKRFNGDFRRDLFENTLKVYSETPTSPIGFEPEYEVLDMPGGSIEVLKIVNGVLQGTYKFKE